jgi:UDPglucose--hexose-1-phosphate uridylyltransferase
VDEDKWFFLWHMEIKPRSTKSAGFEMSSGIYINMVLPEEAAGYLRELKPP